MKTKSKNFWKNFFIFSLITIIPSFSFADSLNQKLTFNVNSTYDQLSREKVSATLIKISDKAYFYIDDKFLDEQDKKKVEKSISDLATAFDEKIYPKLTDIYGKEWTPGIDEDPHIFVLLTDMKKNIGGYFNEGDEFPKRLFPDSNEKEIVYLNSDFLFSKRKIKGNLAHEFTHLITFNQKQKRTGHAEEVWLNELRAEYSPTLVGYEIPYQGSHLKERVEFFIKNPNDSLTEWKNTKYDYGVVTVFGHYLVEHYGIEILSESLHSDHTGILSINDALKKLGYKKDFSQVFTDWAIAVLVNDCSLANEYCFSEEGLKDLRITPVTNFLPIVGNGKLSVTNLTTNWAGNWQRIVGGKDNLKFEFKGDPEVNFKVPYIIEELNGKKKINFLDLDISQKGELFIPDFGKKYISFTFLPLIETKLFGFSQYEKPYDFWWQVTTVKTTSKEQKELEEKIKILTALIEKVKAEIAKIKKQRSFCQGKLEKNLYYGLRNNNDVKCLQSFLASLGPDIYPEKLITGNFLNLTKKAVIRFQEKYKNEILLPIGLKNGTGFVGKMTRRKINKMLGFQ